MAALLSTLTRAAAKKALATFRTFHLSPVYPEWASRTALCARCPVAVTKEGTVYCGNPLLSDIRRAASQGCGCPVLDKAQDPAEHCPLTPALDPRRESEPCDCKWCRQAGGTFSL